MPGIFKTFRSTETPWSPTSWGSYLKLLVDNKTGAPIGIQSQNANGPDGIFTPVDLNAAQILSPTAEMIADLNATYRLNVAPYTRYQSDGTTIVALNEEAADGTNFQGAVLQTIPAGTPLRTIGAYSYAVVYSPFTVQNTAGVSVLGRLDVVTRPA